MLFWRPEYSIVGGRAHHCCYFRHAVQTPRNTESTSMTSASLIYPLGQFGNNGVFSQQSRLTSCLGARTSHQTRSIPTVKCATSYQREYCQLLDPLLRNPSSPLSVRLSFHFPYALPLSQNLIISSQVQKKKKEKEKENKIKQMLESSRSKV